MGIPLRLLPDTLHTTASLLGQLNRTASQLQETLGRTWMRLDTDWDTCAEVDFRSCYNGALDEISRMAAMLSQMSEALKMAADEIAAADQAAAALFNLGGADALPQGGFDDFLIDIPRSTVGRQGGSNDPVPPRCPPGFPSGIWEHLPPEARAWVVEHSLYVLAPDSLNLREGHSRDGRVLASMPEGSYVLWSENWTSDSGEVWYRVSFIDRDGNFHTGWACSNCGGEELLTGEPARIFEKIPPRDVTFTGNNLTPPVFTEMRDDELVNVPPGEDQAQFINDDTDSTWPADPNPGNYHSGLCGEASVAAILNRLFPISLNEVVDDFLTHIRPGTAPDYTGLTELGNLINHYPGPLWAVTDRDLVASAWYGEGQGINDMPAIMNEWLAEGDYIIAGVEINGTTGELGAGTAAHWVVITGVSNASPDGSQWVRVYNPFDNSTEYYTWEDFKDAWGSSNPNKWPSYQTLRVHVNCNSAKLWRVAQDLW